MQEGLDLICYALDCICELADTVFYAVYDAVDDISAPLERLRCKVLDEADRSIEAVDNRVLDMGYRSPAPTTLQLRYQRASALPPSSCRRQAPCELP